MKEGLSIRLNWLYFRRTIIRNLPIIGIRDDRAQFYRNARKQYLRDLRDIPEFGEADILKINLCHAVMVGAIYQLCPEKPTVGQLREFYRSVLTSPRLLRSMAVKLDMLSPESVGKQQARCEQSRKATHPFTWQCTMVQHDADRYTVSFSRCGIYAYLRSRGLGHIAPAMCAIDFTLGEIGQHLFLRKQTLATGGQMCDCTYIRKTAATEEEIRQAAADSAAELARGKVH